MSSLAEKGGFNVTSSLFDGILHKENIIHIGAMFYLAGFLFRNQMLLRGLIIGGDVIYLVYFFLAPATPLWGAIFWSAMFIAVNAWMIGQLVMENRHFSLTDTERKLFNLLQDLTPGQFRALLKLAQQHRTTAQMEITQEGMPLNKLYFVLSGNIAIEKRGRRAVTDAETFIGEIAFLLDRPATATVTLEPGCTYFVWNSAALKKAMDDKPALGTSLIAALNRNLANKVAMAEVSGRRVDLEAWEAM